MRVVIFGASGMVGQGVLRECLVDADVTEVACVSRAFIPTDQLTRLINDQAPIHRDLSKLSQIIVPELFEKQDFESIAEHITNIDACYFPLGVSSVGKSEADYTHITHDLTLSVAKTLAAHSPQAVFVYVSGEGTDTKSKTMWARVKGGTEDALLAMPFRAAYMFRPGAILPKHGIRSKTAAYNVLYRVFYPLFLLASKFPKIATDTETVGRAMLRVTRDLPTERYWNTAAINRIGRS
jgi:uncharacterized protein YbjT (DUF2867 family)